MPINPDRLVEQADRLRLYADRVRDPHAFDMLSEVASLAAKAAEAPSTARLAMHRTAMIRFMKKHLLRIFGISLPRILFSRANSPIG